MCLALAVVARLQGRDTRPGTRQRQGQGQGTRTPAPTQAPGTRHSVAARCRHLFARLILRSPAREFVGQRHGRYLRRLVQQFDQRQWDDALRDAIALGGQGTLLTLRLPTRRTSLTLGAQRPGGASMRYNAAVHQRLRELYRRAASQLEQAGRIREAAFTHADLLGDAGAAVRVLEQHGELRLAAGLAEARKLPADLVVRLWWRAGDHQHATDVARVHGAFAGAVARLTTVDRHAARELRADWVRACQEAGDRLGAVEAAWPEAPLRPMVLPDIRHGQALGGSVGAHLLAYHLAAEKSDEVLDRALDLLDSTRPEDTAVRDQFRTALAALPAADAVHDRRVCTAGLRSLLRDSTGPGAGGGGAGGNPAQRRRVVRALTHRADPVIAADLPPIPHPTRTPDQPLRRTLPAEAGQLPVYDAVPLPDGTLLLAHGDLGARLVSADGRVRARWDVPTHHVVMADHGGSAILVARYGSDDQLRRLDLATRKVRAWTTLSSRYLLPSFDGSLLTIIDDDGIALIDALADKPRVLWRELDRNNMVRGITRSAANLTALVDVPPATPTGERRLELWSWDLPGMTLRIRKPISLSVDVVDMTVVPGALLTLAGPPGAPLVLSSHRGYTTPAVLATGLPAESALVSSGSSHVVLSPHPPDGCSLTVAVAGTTLAEFTLTAGKEVGIREHRDRLAIWTPTGALTVLDRSHAELLAEFRTML